MTLCETANALLGVFGERTLTLVRGEGCYAIDAEGRRYLDFISGIGVNALGYGHPSIVRAIQQQAEAIIHTSNLYENEHQRALAATLAAWSGLDQVFLSNSGAEAMEAAVKCARAYANARGRSSHRIVALDNGFHGRTSGALAVTGQTKYRAPFMPLIPDVEFVTANDLDALRAAADTPDLIAIVAETVQGEGGIYPLAPGFLREILTLCDRRDALWIADETQCGLGRTGERFAYQHFANLVPDICVTAKPLAGGLPAGATMFNRRAAEAISAPGSHGSTFGGGPLVCRAARAFLAEAEALLPHIRQRGAQLQRRLSELASPLIREVRGLGLMAGIELRVENAQGYVQEAQKRGLLINVTHGNVIRLLPPYIVSEREVDEACDILAGLLLLRPDTSV